MYVLSFARAYIYLLFPLWSRLPFFFSSFLHALLFLFFPFLLPCCATVLYVNKNNNNKKKMQSSLLSPFLRSIGFLYLLRCLKKKQFKLQEEKNVVEGFPAAPQGRLPVEMELLLLHEVPLSLFFF